MENQYIILDTSKHPAHSFKNGGKSWDEVKDFDNIAMIVPNPFIVLDFDTADDAQIMMRIVDALDIHCRIMKTDRGYHFWFKSSEQLKNFVKARLAIGIYCDRKVCNKNSYVVIKRNGKMREWLKDFPDDEVDTIPKWLMPLKTHSTAFDFKGMKSGDGRNQALFNYIVYMQDNKWTKDDILTTLEIINAYVFAQPLPPSEFSTICRDESFKDVVEVEESEPEESSDGKFKFKHNVFADGLMEKLNIISEDGNLYMYVDGYYKPNNMDIESEMIKEFPEIKESQRQEVLKYLKIKANTAKNKDKYIHPSPYEINLINCRLNIKTGEISLHDSKYLDFCRIPVVYNPKARCDALDEFLNSIFKHDQEVLDLVEEMLGDCLLSENIYQKAFIFFGSGANGKSTFFYIVRKFLGEENVSSIELDKLGVRFQTAELEHKLANIGDDLNYTGIKSNGTIKKLISGDAVQIERKNETPYSFTSYATNLFATNELPRSNDKSDGMMRRLCFIPCLAKFGRGQQNPNLKFDLVTKDALSHLLNRAINGMRRLQKNGEFTLPSVVQRAKEVYIVENSTVLSWIADEDISLDKVLNTSATNLYLMFCNWCRITNIKEITGKKMFNKEVIQKFGLSSQQKKKRTDDGFARFFMKMDEQEMIQ